MQIPPVYSLPALSVADVVNCCKREIGSGKKNRRDGSVNVFIGSLRSRSNIFLTLCYATSTKLSKKFSRNTPSRRTNESNDYSGGNEN